MNNPPPPISNPSRQKLFVRLAAASWVSFVIAILLDLALAGLAAFVGARVKLILPIVFAIGLFALAATGILSGLIALYSVCRQGKKGILAPAIIGLSLWLVIGGVAMAIAIPSFLRARERALALRGSTQLAPARHAPSAALLHDAELGFTLDLPQGYKPFPAGHNPLGYRYAYSKQGRGQPDRVFAVKPLGKVIAKGQHLHPNELQQGIGSTVVAFNWRGLPVDGGRVPEKFATIGEYVTFNIRVPLKQEGLLLTFGGPAAAEADLHALAGDVLASLDGDTNW
jgi:hypothetical protein